MTCQCQKQDGWVVCGACPFGAPPTIFRPWFLGKSPATAPGSGQLSLLEAAKR